MPADRNLTAVRARELRRSMTLPEGLLWRVLRQRPDGMKFRRQHPLGSYIVDFYCPAARLVVEVDGDSHSMGKQPEHDARRDRWISDQGLRIVRFSARDVMSDLQPIIVAIMRACRA